MLAWIVFASIVTIILLVDLHKGVNEIGIKESLRTSALYIAIAVLFSVFVWYELGAQSAQEYLTAYIIEKTLSLDNMFVMIAIFKYLAIPKKYQHKVLLFGIIGVILLRGTMIYTGVKLVVKFHQVLYVFSLVLITMGLKMLFARKRAVKLADGWLIMNLKKYLPLTHHLHDGKFVITLYDPKTNRKKIYFTPLFLALVVIESMDAIFAIDSIPAIFTITTEPYIIFTSNLFAILGLRALYFALDSLNNKYNYLHYALSLILIFIGSKIFLPHISITVSLFMTVSLITGAILLSVFKSSTK